MPVRRRLIYFITAIQCILFLAHLLIYETWTSSLPATADLRGARLGFGLLSVSFVGASLLAFRYTNALVRAFYRAAAVWLGLLSFLFLASILSWVIFVIAHLVGLSLNFHNIVQWMFSAAVVAGTL